jgi:hypothetical protein
VLKISKSGPEPAARAARVKRPSPHNAAPAPGQAAATAPAEATPEALAGAGEARRKAAAKRARGLQAQAPPVQAQTPKLAGGFAPDAALPALETNWRPRENGPAGAKNAAKRAAGASVSGARPRLGPAGRRLKRWLARHFDATQLESVRPLADELLSLADSLHEVRCELSSGVLATSERVKLRRLETQLSGAFGRTWRLLGLADDAPATMPRGRPPRPE